MKARNNNTGEVVTNFGFSKEFGTVSYIDSKGVLTFNTPNSCEWTIIDEEEMNFDWQSFRAEAAKDFVEIICNHKYNVKEEWYPIICKEAIALADELIKQLKEKEEK